MGILFAELFVPFEIREKNADSVYIKFQASGKKIIKASMNMAL